MNSRTKLCDEVKDIVQKNKIRPMKFFKLTKNRIPKKGTYIRTDSSENSKVIDNKDPLKLGRVLTSEVIYGKRIRQWVYPNR